MNEEQIEAYKNTQLSDILEIRNLMQDILCNSSAETLLCVGEGNQWQGTWTAHCIRNNALPKTIKLIVLLDLCAWGNSIFHRPELWKKENYTILPVIGDATNLQFSSNYFDIVAAPLMIDDCINHRGLLRELFRCSKKNGVIMISGHGIDISGELLKIPTLLGTAHKNPILPSVLDEYIAEDFYAEEIKKWENNHAWLRVYKKL